ncbi:MAG: two-component sensor histidine kinase, partial [Bacteroidales bacterium]|nr:two-component sensor histidine kinase [Bacteroidales bacterium]
MRKRGSFKRRILVFFSVIIALFTVGIILFEHQQLEKERRESLERMLDNDAEIIRAYLKEHHLIPDGDVGQVEEILKYMQPELRLTIINWQGGVMYDNLLEADTMENHLQRPEIEKSIALGRGSNIRLSSSNSVEYLYHAKKYDDAYFIRVALPYDVELKSFINAGNSFAYYILLFFIVCVLMMIYFADRFSKSMRELRAFSLNVKKGSAIPPSLIFTDDEVGEVSADIVENYNLLQENRRKLAAEREKLLQHFQFS